MRKILKNILSHGIVFVVSGIIFTIIGVYAATQIASSQVTYNNTTVDAALNDLYNKAANMTIYRDEICPGCVYRKNAKTKYNVNSTSSNKTDNNSKLSSSEYTTDYTTLNSNYFLGHVIDSSGYILESYACGINNGIFFCLRGVDSNQSSLTYKPFFQENINRMNKVFPSCNATASGSTANCFGGVDAYVDSYGYVIVSSGSSSCGVFYDGYSFCN